MKKKTIRIMAVASAAALLFGGVYLLTKDDIAQKKAEGDLAPFMPSVIMQDALAYAPPESVTTTTGTSTSETTSEEAQNLINERKKPRVEKLSIYPLSKKILCSHCGSTFKKQIRNGKAYWVCRNHYINAESCDIKRMPETEIFQAFIRLHNKLLHHHRSILLPLQQMLQELKCKKYGGNAQIMDIHKEIARLREQNHVIARLRTKGFMDEGKYQEQSKELNNKIRKLQAELKKITRSDDEDDVLEQLDMLVDYFEKREHMMVSFEPETFDSMVDKITANQNELTFHLLGGLELKEKI